MKSDLIRFIAILVIILFFSYFVYPTPFYYTTGFETNAVIKINRFTGTTYVLNPNLKEWTLVVK